MSNDPFIPKGAVPLVASMMVFALVAVAGARVLGYGPQDHAVPTADTTLAIAHLTFADTAEGGIEVVSATGDARVYEPGSAGFIRGVLRGLARQRRGLDVGAEAPFVLALLPNHRLVMHDPQTGTRIDLRAFGKDNRAAFAALLPLGERGRATPDATTRNAAASDRLAAPREETKEDG